METIKYGNYSLGKKCKICSKEITNVSTFCFQCAMKKRKTNILKVCPICKSSFRVFNSDAKFGMGKYCSKECKYNGLKERVFTKEQCEKISKALKGRISPTLGMKFPEVALRKSGKNASNWRGGKSFEPYCVGWGKTLKEAIRQRDGHKCKMCGVHQMDCIRSLDVHHIDYNKKNINPSNLIALCVHCHMKTNYAREKWTSYFSGASNG